MRTPHIRKNIWHHNNRRFSRVVYNRRFSMNDERWMSNDIQGRKCQCQNTKILYMLSWCDSEEGRLLAYVREKYGPFSFKWKYLSVRIFYCMVPISRPQIITTKNLANHRAKNVISQSKRRQTMSLSMLSAGKSQLVLQLASDWLKCDTNLSL